MANPKAQPCVDGRAQADFERRLAILRSRWPAIAEAADHPIAEHLHAARFRRRWQTARTTAIALASVAAVMGLAAAMMFPPRWIMQLIPFWPRGPVAAMAVYTAGLLTVTVFLRSRLRLYPAPTVTLGLSGKENLQNLWLTPLTVRDMAGSEALRVLTGFRAPLTAVSIQALLGLAIGWQIWRRTAPETLREMANGALLFAGAAFLAFTMAWIMSSDASRIRLVGDGLRNVLLHPRRKFAPFVKRAVRPLGLGILALAAGVWAIKPLVKINPPLGVYGIALVALALFFLVRARREARLETEKKFFAAVAEAEPLYAELVRSLGERPTESAFGRKRD